MMFLVSMDIIGHYFVRHRGKVYTGSMTSFSVGLLIGPTLLEYLIATMFYKNAMITMGLINSLSFPIAFVYRGQCGSKARTVDSDPEEPRHGDINSTYVPDSREIHTSWQTAKPSAASEVNTCPDKMNDSESDIKVNIHTKLESVESSEPDQNTAVIVTTAASHIYVLRDCEFILILLYFMFATFGENTFYSLAVDFSVSLGILSLEEAALGMTITSISVIVSCLALALLSHWVFDRLALAIFSVMFLGVTLLFMTRCSTLVTLYSLFVLFGVMEGLFIANGLPWIDEHFNQQDYFTVRMSYVNFVLGLGSLAGPMACGYVIKVAGMSNVFYLTGAVPLVGAFIILPLWIRRKFQDCRRLNTTNASV